MTWIKDNLWLILSLLVWGGMVGAALRAIYKLFREAWPQGRDK